MVIENSVLKDICIIGFICLMKCLWNRFLNIDCFENGFLCIGSNK